MVHHNVIAAALDHARKTDDFVQAEYLSDYLENLFMKPLPKLCTSYRAIYKKRTHKDRHKKLEDKEVEIPRFYPTRAVNFTRIIDPKNVVQNAYANRDFKNRTALALETKILKARNTALQELEKIGVAVVTFDHATLLPSSVHLVRENLLELPRSKLEGNPAHPKEVPDFDGAITMLAYLLHKKLLNKTDVIESNKRYDAERMNGLHGYEPPFSLRDLQFAESVGMKNQIRKALGERLLPDKEAKRYSGLEPEDPGIRLG